MAQEAGSDENVTTADDLPGEVVFTALEDGIWARFYDGNGSRLFEKQMAQGERFVVPAEASSPQIWTGRPDAFSITIGGRSVPKLAEADTVLRDVLIDAASLLARPEPIASASPVATSPANDSAPRNVPIGADTPAQSPTPAVTVDNAAT